MRLSFTDEEKQLLASMPQEAKAFVSPIIENQAFLNTVCMILLSESPEVVDGELRTVSIPFNQEQNIQVLNQLSFLFQAYFSIKVFGYSIGSDAQLTEMAHNNYFSLNYNGLDHNEVRPICKFSFISDVAHQKFHDLKALAASISNQELEANEAEERVNLPH